MRCLAAIPCLLLCAIAHAADGGVLPSEPVENELEEVLVKGTRLWQLRQAMLDAEDRFYARYNELNTNDDFDVHCAQTATLGTRLKRRGCQVAYVEDAQAEYAQALVGGFNDAPAPELVWLERYAEYRQVALKVINGDRRLLKLVKERERLEKKYDEERRKRFKGRLVLFE